MSIRVVIADDRAIARQGLRMILGRAEDIEVVGEATDRLDPLGQVQRRRPDAHPEAADGRARSDAAPARAEGLEVVVVTTFDLDEYVLEALRAGGVGFLVEDSPPERIIDAVRVVARGDALISPEVTRRLLDGFVSAAPSRAGDPALAELTPRERHVLHREAEEAERPAAPSPHEG